MRSNYDKSLTFFEYFQKQLLKFKIYQLYEGAGGAGAGAGGMPGAGGFPGGAGGFPGAGGMPGGYPGAGAGAGDESGGKV